MLTKTINPENDVKKINGNFSNLLNELFNHRHVKENIMCENVWAPRVNVVEDKNEFLLEIDLPGVSEKDVKITAHNEKLDIEGERKACSEKIYIREEISKGKFCRSFKLPDNVESNKIEAAFKNGILSIKLTKKEESKPKEVSIKIN
ncbi:MAG: Hsp20/alpha crystallin family protein [Calditrichia bacterium]|nr:Hsp20/alpha crystallin family protein [Calditrichia bacterium]